MNVAEVETQTTFLQHDELSAFEKLLQEQLRGRVRKLRLVRTAEGVVLSGYAATYYAKQLAQHSVLKDSPFPLLANRIEVLQPTGE